MMMMHTQSLIRQIRKRSGFFLDCNAREAGQLALEIRNQRHQGLENRRLMADCYAITSAVIQRQTGMTLRPVQILAAIGLARGRIIEMQTGEGKTLSAVPAVAWYAMTGRGCHVVTSNPYLAQRDTEFLRPIYQHLGLSVGCVTPDTPQEDRAGEYACDITYSTASEIGFDFLRDRLAAGGSPDRHYGQEDQFGGVHRPFYAAIVDEADSVLIDEASTPLVIGVEGACSEAETLMFRWANEMSMGLSKDQHFKLKPQRMQAPLTRSGAEICMLSRKPRGMNGFGSEELLQQVEQSLVARFVLEKGRDYVVEEDEVMLISGSTGRRLQGRKWQRGLHQAVELKESMALSSQTRTSARISIQELFSRYQKLGGMTGTARSAKREFKMYYQAPVVNVPTHLPSKRRCTGVCIFGSADEKRHAIVAAAKQITAKGRPVLVGTPSVEASELLSKEFQRNGIELQLLNAMMDADESKIIAGAGQRPVVTVATNMAGRGTDILLSDEVRAAGGLHVIMSEMHDSRRIDRQLIGRCARQGDPGTYELFLSAEDSIWQGVRTKMNLRFQDFQRRQRAIESDSSARRRRAFGEWTKQSKKLRRAGLDMYLEVPT